MQKINSNLILVDVRSPQEYEEGHLQNSINLPVYKLKDDYKKVLPNKEQEIIIYCKSGARSKKAVKILQELGYQALYHLANGLEGNQ
ncbi:MAG TPA: rhodanese-like domain-containing protein [Candidatus Merdicola faecigallinarum]|uniref:Rhodanese-like domain-containing protein n=1 Tax=Candidatus Merdicola faecigallinarum TaxID=2840862 RepID=A0A9D1S997_9FIRM|nr:rhodanese-like domain-containing protein [Candidatus Merdicola faecigallinarum]